MRIRNNLRLLGCLMLCSFAAGTSAQDAGPAASDYTDDGIGGTPEDAGLAIANPDEFAWHLFAELNQPSDEGDGTVVWENWALARLVYDNPDLKPDDLKWDSVRRPSSQKRVDRFDSLPIQQQILRAAREKELGHGISVRGHRASVVESNTNTGGPPTVSFDPNLAGIGGAPAENDEVRMNFSAFETVRENELYSIDGQEKAFERNTPITFDSQAKEIKAEWRNITKLSDEQRMTYHTASFEQNGEPQVWGLVALHITTKDLPNWFWATWEHESNRQIESVVPSRDRWGARLRSGSEEFDVQDRLAGNEKGDHYPEGKRIGPSTKLVELLESKGLTAEKWKHYLLRGTQIDFTDKFGRPTVLANSVIEEGFQDTSSCITCHAKAGIGPRLRRSDEKNMLPVFASVNPPIGDVGVPDATWFGRSDTVPASRSYLQLDFVWSTIRAKRKGSAKADGQEHPLVGEWSYQAFADNDQVVSDPNIGDKVLGTGILSISSVDDGQFKGKLKIYESTVDNYWDLKVSGSARLEGETWILNYVAHGVSPENDPDSRNFWLYRYEDVRSVDGNTFVGRVRRVVKHLKGTIAKELRDAPPKGEITAEQIRALGDEAFYDADQTGSFSMNRR